MSNDESTTPDNRAGAQKETLTRSEHRKSTFARQLVWLGVKSTEMLCLVAIGPRGEAYRRKNCATVAAYAAPGLALRRLVAAEDVAPMMDAEGLYLMPNQMHPDLAARDVADDWVAGAEQPKDHEVVRRRVVVVDCDPQRIKKVSSTQEELDLSRESAELIHARLASILGSAESLAFACSGNGFHVLVALDIATESDGREMTDPARGLVERFLGALAVLHDTDRVKVDRSVVEARRIFPAYGTLKAKGRNTPERPHRPTTFEPTVARPVRLGLEQFSDLVVRLEAELTPEQLAEIRKESKPKAAPSKGNVVGEDRLALCNAVDVADVYRRLGYSVEAPTCLSCGHEAGKGDTSVKVLEGVVKCLHGTCGGKAYGPVGLVAKAMAGVDELKGNKDAVKTVLAWFEQQGLIESSSSKKKAKTFSAEELESMGYSFEAANDLEADDDEPAVALPAQKRNLTDTGNAERLVDRHGDKIRYCVEWACWLVYNGTRWVRDVGAVEIRRLAVETVRSIYAEAAVEQDIARRIALGKHAAESERRAAISAMVGMAEPLVPIHVDNLDRDKWALNVPNGTVDLRTGKLRAHDPRDFITKVTTVEFDPCADRSKVDAAFAKSHPDADMRAYLWRLWGYSCSGAVEQHVFPIHWGKGRNGKGLFLNAILHQLGDYACMVPTELMMETRGEQHPAVRATLFGVRFALASESEENARLKVALIKQLCGGDAISARGMRENFFTFTPTHQIHLMLNPKPVITVTEDPIWERIHLIPWDVVIPPSERDTKLPERMKTEKGLLRALVDGCVDYVQCGGLAVPEAVKAATEAYKSESDVLGQFVEDCLDVTEEPEDYVTSADLYAAYHAWCEANGKKVKAQNRFSQDLDKAGIGTPGRDNVRKRFRSGVKLLDGGRRRDPINDLSGEELDDLLEEEPASRPSGVVYEAPPADEEYLQQRAAAVERIYLRTGKRLSLEPLVPALDDE